MSAEGAHATPDDDRHMATALALARRALGCTWPNPAVGCIIVRDGRVVGRGWTQRGGRPHAESEALGRAGAAAHGATVYVSLEPCSHHGQTPPCAQAVVDAGIRRAVVAVTDPDPRVSGRGLARLAAAGIDVVTGVRRDEAVTVNAGFFLRCLRGRPLFTWKMAVSLDGRIAAAGGDSRWITGAAARDLGHRLRAGHDAVLIGAQTAIVDDPLLTCRLPGLADRSPVRIVVDRRLRLPPSARLVTSAGETPTWVVTAADADPTRKRDLRDAGVRLIELTPDADGRIGPRTVATALGEAGLTRVLIEGGGALAAAWLSSRLVDRLVCFRAPMLVGGDGVPMAAAFGVARIADAPRFVPAGAVDVAGDFMETYVAEQQM